MTVRTIAASLLGMLACQPHGAEYRRPPAVEQLQLLDLAGQWRWLQRTEESGTSRVEDEQWQLEPAAHGGLTGHYLRTVTVRSLDGLPFACNQQTSYRQRALFDVTITATPSTGFIAHESAYVVEPSPCDHGFRRTSDYEVVPHGSRMALLYPGGSQMLWQIQGEPGAAGEAHADLVAPWPTADPIPRGTWRWHTRSYDDDANVREEWETWELTARGEDHVDGTYRRRVVVTSRSGDPIACAGAPTWTFEDVYAVDGEREREGELWKLRERGVSAGAHACLARTPARTLDEATGELTGDFLVLEWRGKRRQVLHR